jgi:hypothetical protein
VKQRMPQALAASTACGLKRRPTIMPRACSATAFGPAQPAFEGVDHLCADGVLVVLAFDEVARFVEALPSSVATRSTRLPSRRLLGLDAVAEQAQQVGHAFLEALALRRAQPRVAGVVEVPALSRSASVSAALSCSISLSTASSSRHSSRYLPTIGESASADCQDRLAAAQVAALWDFDQAAGGELEFLLPHQLQANLDVGCFGRDRRRDEPDLQRTKQPAAGPPRVFGVGLQPRPYGLQAAGVLRPVVADEHGDVGQQRGRGSRRCR